MMKGTTAEGGELGRAWLTTKYTEYTKSFPFLLLLLNGVDGFKPEVIRRRQQTQCDAD